MEEVRYQMSDIRKYQVSGGKYQGASIRKEVSGIKYQDFELKHQASGALILDQGTGTSPCSKNKGSGNQVSGCRIQVSRPSSPYKFPNMNISILKRIVSIVRFGGSFYLIYDILPFVLIVVIIVFAAPGAGCGGTGYSVPLSASRSDF